MQCVLAELRSHGARPSGVPQGVPTSHLCTFLNIKEINMLLQLNREWNYKTKQSLFKKAQELIMIYLYDYRPDHTHHPFMVYSEKIIFHGDFGLRTQFYSRRKNLQPKLYREVCHSDVGTFIRLVK